MTALEGYRSVTSLTKSTKFDSRSSAPASFQITLFLAFLRPTGTRRPVNRYRTLSGTYEYSRAVCIFHRRCSKIRLNIEPQHPSPSSSITFVRVHIILVVYQFRRTTAGLRTKLTNLYIHLTTKAEYQGMMEGIGGPVDMDPYSLKGIDPTLDACCQREVSQSSSGERRD
jgi:hypothetical protein